VAELTHYQAGKPVHWQLADEVDLPNGRHLSGSKARVYEVLRLAKETAHCFPVGMVLSPPGWVPVWVFREPWSGGSAGDRRIRDLRQLGVPLEAQPFDSGGPAGSSSWIWRLGDAGSTSSRSDRPNPRKNESGPQARVSAAVLSSVSFVLRPGGRPAVWAGELVDLSPGMPHVAAPAVGLAQAVIEGRLTADEALEAYRQQLLGAYHSGELVSAFRAGTTFTICCDVPFPALQVLQRALAKLGAIEGGPA
jgi:hypothetical protein